MTCFSFLLVEDKCLLEEEDVCNHGVCVTTEAGIVCECRDGYIGEFCQCKYGKSSVVAIWWYFESMLKWHSGRTDSANAMLSLMYSTAVSCAEYSGSSPRLNVLSVAFLSDYTKFLSTDNRLLLQTLIS